jgi:hypothetical protein
MKTICKNITLSLVTFMLLCGTSFSQEKKAALICAVPGAQGKKTATLELSFIKKSDQSKTVTAKIVSRNAERKFVPVPDVSVSFYTLKDKEQLLLGKSPSDESGKASFTLPKDIPLDPDGTLNLIAKIENNTNYSDAEESLHYKSANLVLNLNPADTGKMVTAMVTEMAGDRTLKPIKNVVIKFYVQRLFGDMPAADENTSTTNEKGEATFNYPKKVPGGAEGTLIVTAKIEDNDQYGNVESRMPAPWGAVVAPEKDPFPRALWAPNAPPQIIIVLCVLFGGVWSIYGYIIYTLRKMKKEGAGAEHNGQQHT